MSMNSFPSSWRRRFRDIVNFGEGAMRARRTERAYAHVAWLMIAGLIYCIWNAHEFGVALIPTFCLAVILVAIALFDARYFIVPDLYALALAAIGALRAALLGSHIFIDGLIAAALAYGGLRGASYLYARRRGVPGLGQGDAKLLGAGGFWIGVAGLPTCLLEATLSALLSLIILARLGNKLHARSAIAFGPHLALAIWLVWIFGPLR